MYNSSTQRRFWTYRNEEELNRMREAAHRSYIDRYGSDIEDEYNYFLSFNEEKQLLQHYEHLLRDFCRRFEPPMPPSVMATSCSYFKRFYLNNTPMDHHPWYIMLVCVYLAAKVEEFNVSIMQFVANLPEKREQTAEVILSHELLLMQQLNFHLTIHSSFRPMEGLLIDIKTRYKMSKDPESLRQGAEEFIYRSLATNACLLFSPSQVAIAAIVASASNQGINLESYISEKLVGTENHTVLKELVEQIKRAKHIVKNIEPLKLDRIKQIENKLEKCRNQELNPDSEMYKEKLRERLHDDEEISIKRQIKEERQRREDAELLL